MASSLGRTGFLPAYHMNKTNWVSIRLDGAAAETDVAALLESVTAWQTAEGGMRNV